MDSRQVMIIGKDPLGGPISVIENHTCSPALKDIISLGYPCIIAPLTPYNLTGKSTRGKRIQAQFITIISGKDKISCIADAGSVTVTPLTFREPPLPFSLSALTNVRLLVLAATVVIQPPRWLTVSCPGPLFPADVATNTPAL